MISAPVIQSHIPGGSGIITGNFTVEESTNLAVLLRAGALPAGLEFLEERTIGPELGADSIEAGTVAAAKLVRKYSTQHRVELPLSKLVLGSECGGGPRTGFVQLLEPGKSSSVPRGGWLLVGAGPLLSTLHSNGVRCAVISNDTRRGIDGFLSQHHLSALITERWSADDEPRKPDPQAVEQLCARLGIAPQRCALIGDAETDLQMAAAAGIPLLIGFTGGWARQPELPSATHHLNDWNDLGMAAGP